MDESFELPVDYQGREIVLPGKLTRRGYSYQLHIEVEGVEIIFEPDEERNFRAMIDHPDAQKKINIDLVRAIGEALDKLLR